MQRLARSWTRWRQSRRAARLLRRQEKAALLLTPLLYQALTPVAEAMARLDARQQETRQLVQALVEMPRQPEPQTQELLLEILSSLQPTAQEQIVPLLGPPPLPTSSPSSAS
jgi:hypothetical protein